jgi:hypothetical protein
LNTAITTFAAILLAAASIGFSNQAQAAGCLRGAVVGGIAGHYAGHHGMVGAGLGCAIGHHEETKRLRDEREYRRW